MDFFETLELLFLDLKVLSLLVTKLLPMFILIHSKPVDLKLLHSNYVLDINLQGDIEVVDWGFMLHQVAIKEVCGSQTSVW